jgi:putative ABC transport system substrate-binding protein
MTDFDGMGQPHRRRFLLGAGALLAAPLAGAQAPKLPVVAYVFGGRTDAELAGPDPRHPHARAFVHRLRELGWEDGRAVKLERYGPENQVERVQQILADLAARNVAVIHAASAVRGTLVAKMAMQATRTVPIVFSGGSDPVALGLVASLARPGGNVTGVTSDAGPGIMGKRLELLKEIVPGVSKVAYFGSPSQMYGEVIREAAAQLKLRLTVSEVDRSEQLDAAFTRVTRERPDALIVGTLGFLGTQAPRLVAFAAERRLPAIYAFPEAVDAGGLASYGIDFLDLNRRAADYVNRILRGAKPAELPVELPRKFELALNLKTARSLGIRIPSSVQLRADRVIE